MIPARAPGATPHVAAPGDEENVQPLPVVARIVNLRDGSKARILESMWTPTPDELERLNRGANVVLSIMSLHQPPVDLSVGEPPTD